jgi:hypothetical protein
VVEKMGGAPHPIASIAPHEEVPYETINVNDQNVKKLINKLLRHACA